MAGTRQVKVVFAGDASGAQAAAAKAGTALGHTGEAGEKASTKIGHAFGTIGSKIGGEFGGILTAASEGLEKFGETGGHTGAKLMAAGAGVTALGVEFLNLSSGEKAAHQQLAAAIEATGHTWGDYSEEIDKAIKKGEDFGHTGADTQNALQRLTEATDNP